MENKKVFPIGNSDLALLDMQAKAFSGTKKFKNAIKEKRIADSSSNKQLFFGEGRAVWNLYLRQTGRLLETSASIKSEGKYAFAESLVAIIQGLESIQTFKFTDSEKGQGAIRTDEADFEFGITLHRKPVIEDISKPQISGVLNDHIEEVASKLTASGYKVVFAKNNQITVQKENEDKQLSVRFTRKKMRLEF